MKLLPLRIHKNKNTTDHLMVWFLASMPTYGFSDNTDDNKLNPLYHIYRAAATMSRYNPYHWEKI